MSRNIARTSILAWVLLIAAACASRPQGPPPFDPVGTYDFTTDFQGTALNGTITLRRNPDGTLGGTISSQAGGDVAIGSVTENGRRLDLRTSVQNQELVMSLEFSDNDRFAGGWSIGQMASGSLSGTRRAQPGR